MPPAWILASSSLYRKKLLATILSSFETLSPEVEEVHEPQGHPAIWGPQTNAHRKAAWVAEKFPYSYVIGADTVAIFQENVFNKPKDFADAKRMLQFLSGKTHQAVTGLEIIRKSDSFHQAITVSTNITFDTLTDTFIEHYLQQTEYLKVAGAYSTQHPLTQTFVHIQGSSSNVGGFPIEAFREFFQKLSANGSNKSTHHFFPNK